MGKRTLKPAAPAPSIDDAREDELESGFDLDDDDEDGLWDDDEDLDDDDGDAPTDEQAITACKYCGCTEASACDTADGPCSWIPGDELVCDKPECLRKYLADGGTLSGELLERADPGEPIDETDPPIAEREAGMPIGIADALPGRPAVMELVVEIPLDDIVPDPDQPRTDVDDELTASVEAEGVKQPIVVRRHPRADSGKLYMIVDGERRWTAAIAAGLDTIRARVTDRADDEGERLLLQVTLNEGKRLAPMEEAKAWKRIMDAKGWNIQQLASALGRAKSTVSDRLAMLNAPAPFQPLFAKNVLPAAAAPIIRKYANLPERVVRGFAKALTEEFDDFVKTETSVPLGQLEHTLRHSTYSVGLRNITHSKDAAKAYGGDVCEINGEKFAVDGAAWDKHNQEYFRQRNLGSRDLSASERRADEQRRAREAAERKQQQLKQATRRAQFTAIAAKLPGSIGGSANQAGGWSSLLVDLVMQEVHQDTLRVLAAQLNLTADKSRKGGMSPYADMIKRHAAKLNPSQRVQLALQLLLVPDLAIPSYAMQGADRLAAAARLLKLDLKKVKAPAAFPAKKAAAKKPASKGGR